MQINSPLNPNFSISESIMNYCIATLISLNLSIKAQKVLAREGIYATVVSLDPSVTPKGCAYGIKFSCNDQKYIKALLKREKIHPSQYLNNI